MEPEKNLILRVTLDKGLTWTPWDQKEDRDLTCSLQFRWKEGNAPTIAVSLLDARNSYQVELNDCLDFEALKRATESNISLERLRSLCIDVANPAEILERLLEDVLAPVARLRIALDPDSQRIAFRLTIGTFKTSADVEPSAVQHFVIPSRVEEIPD